MRDLLGGQTGALRFEPTTKRVRAMLDGEPVVDSGRAVLVWEPRRIVPTYAVPADDIRADLVAVETPVQGELPEGFPVPDLTTRPMWGPTIPFAVRLTTGTSVELRAGRRTIAAFQPDDEALAGYVILDFRAFDSWLEEEREIVSHPHDPFHRIDVLPTRRRIRILHRGQLLAETSRARMLFETMLPPRYYLPPEDVLVELEPTSTRSWCAYKGEADYCSVRVIGETLKDIAWRYRDPLDDGVPVTGLVAFYDEKLDLVVDGEPVARSRTPWS